jgi:hypothetical protein
MNGATAYRANVDIEYEKPFNEDNNIYNIV